MVLPGARYSDLPPVDEYVVEPETRQEMIDGRIVHALPASPPHAELHGRLDSILYHHAAPGYVMTSDMLTRTSERWNFAADAAIRKIGTDPATGHRYLEELAFEVKHKQSMKNITSRACQLAGRGVRRVFAICVRSRKERGEDVLVKAGPVIEWIPGEDRWTEGHWQELDEDAVIEDACLHSPIRVRALLDAAEASDAVAHALLAQSNRVLAQATREAAEQAAREATRAAEQAAREAAEQAAREATRAAEQAAREAAEQAAREATRAAEQAAEAARIEIMREAILDMCDLLGIEPTPARRARIEALDVGGLLALRDHLKTHRRWDP